MTLSYQQISEALERLSAPLEALERLWAVRAPFERLSNTPNGKGWTKLVELLKANAQDPLIVASPVASEFLSIVTELAGDALSARDALEVFVPLDRELPMGAAHVRFVEGRKTGTVGPWRKRIASMLKKSRGIKNAAIWAALAEKPPKGWTFMKNEKFGQYFDGPKPGQEFKLTTFRVYASEERKKLKA